MRCVHRLRTGLLVAVLTGLPGVLPAARAQDPPPEPGLQDPRKGDGRKRDRGRDGLRMDAPPADAGRDDEPNEKPAAERSEPELLVEALGEWPAVDAKRAAVRLAAQPSIAFDLCKTAMLRPKQDWRMIAGLAAAFGHMRKPEALELLEAKLQDRTMFQHPQELLDALVRIDPVGGRTRLLGSLLHPASAVVEAAGDRLTDRVTEADVPTLRDIYEAGGVASRSQAVRLIAKADPEGSRADLIRALRDKAPTVCVEAARALAADDGEATLALLQKAVLAPIDRQMAYAYLALGLRAERTREKVLRTGDVLVLTGSRGLNSLNPLNRAVAAIVLADAGYLHEIPEVDTVYDEKLVPVLLDTWVGREFWNDMTVIQPLALRRLARLTGQTSLREPRDWITWWTQNEQDFQARRILVQVAPENVPTLVVTVRGSAAPGGETTILAADASLLPPPMSDEMILLLPAADAAALMTKINASNVLRSGGSIAEDLEGIGPLGISVEAGKRRQYVALRPEFLAEPIQSLVEHIDGLRKRFAWQRYRPLGSAVDLGTFVHTMAPRFEESDAEEARALLARLMAQSVAGLNEDRDLAALRDLAADPALPRLLGPDEVNHLLTHLGRRDTVDAMARGLVRVLALSGNESATPLLMEFALDRPSADTQELLTVILAQAGNGALLEATRSEDARVRIAALASLTPETDRGTHVALARKGLEDETPTVQAEAVRALGRLRSEASREELEQLASKSGALRIAAIEALGYLGGKDSLAALMSAYASEDAAVRLTAVRSLAETREPEGLSAVVFAMSGDPSALVREVASRSVRDIGSDQAAAALRKLAIDPGQPEIPRSTALQSFAQLRGPKAADDLVRLLYDPSEMVADQAALSLAAWRRAEAIPRLIEMLQKGRSTSRAREALESVSLESFGQSDPEILASLYSGWHEVAQEVGPKGWLVDALLRRGVTSEILPRWVKGEADREMVPILLEAVEADEWYLRRAADLALREILGRNVGEQSPWTTPGERSRMAQAWSRIWGEILGR